MPCPSSDICIHCWGCYGHHWNPRSPDIPTRVSWHSQICRHNWRHLKAAVTHPKLLATASTGARNRDLSALWGHILTQDSCSPIEQEPAQREFEECSFWASSPLIQKKTQGKRAKSNSKEPSGRKATLSLSLLHQEQFCFFSSFKFYLMCVWWSEDKSIDSLISFCTYVGSENRTRVLRLAEQAVFCLFVCLGFLLWYGWFVFCLFVLPLSHLSIPIRFQAWTLFTSSDFQTSRDCHNKCCSGGMEKGDCMSNDWVTQCSNIWLCESLGVH